jgi:hypothetical protein
LDERIIIWKEFGQTVLDPLAFGSTLVLGALLVLMPRRHALLPFLVAASFIPIDQRIVVGGADFNMIRILVLLGWVRIFSKGEASALRWHTMDFVFIAWLLSGTVIHSLREPAFLVWRVGQIFEAGGTYFLFRCLLRTPTDVRSSFGYFAAIAIPIALFMTVEYATGRNMFSVFGGVPEFTVEREGRLRCQGAFPHPILAGDFGGGLAPLIIGYALAVTARRWLSLAGLAGSVAIVILSASSGPLLSLMGGITAWLLWPLRRQMYLVRWALVAVAVGLQLVMNHPIWFLFAVVGMVGGSTGWHRYALIDAFIRNYSEWVVLGTNSTAHWGWGLQDVTNHFVLEGVRGGFATFALFLALVVLAFRSVGRGLVYARRGRAPGTRTAPLEFILWGIGASLFAHSMAMTAVAYVDQMAIVFYTLLATIPSLEQMLAPRRAAVAPPVRAATSPA